MAGIARRSRHPAILPRRQSGLALAIVLVLMVTGAIAAIVAVASPQQRTSSADQETDLALAEARSALIFRAAMDDNRPGSLPCPDTNNDGIAEPLVGGVCASYIGRLPWQDLGLPDLRDGSGERLWYALSPSLRDDDSAQPINSDTAAQLSVTGAVPQTNVAAVIISPGQALAGQLRDLANQNNVASYLEGDNANADNVYHVAASTATFNDRIEVITRDQLFAVVESRVARDIRRTLRNYFTTYGYYPYANDYGSGGIACTNGQMRGRVPNPDSPNISATCATNNDWGGGLSTPPPPWFFANSWHLITYYSLAPACTPATPACGGAGFLTVNGMGTQHAIVIVGSRALGTQVRPCVVAADCIEQPSAGVDQYTMQARTSTFNDRVMIVAP